MQLADIHTIEEAARKLGIREQTLRRRIARGTVQPEIVLGVQVLTTEQLVMMQPGPQRKGRRPSKRGVA